MMTGCLPAYHHHHRKHVHQPLPPLPEAEKDSPITVDADNPPPKVEEKKKSRRSKSFFGVLSLQRHSDKKSNADDGENPKAVQHQEIGLSDPPVKAASAGDMAKMDQPLSPSRSPSPPSTVEMRSDYASTTSLSEFISDSIIYTSDGEDAEEEGLKVATVSDTADEAIDSKADEFIAQFYQQIQIQNTCTINSGEFCR